MSHQTDINSAQWSFKKRTIARVLWLSFLSAAIGFFIIFGVIDPGSLDLAFSFHFPLTRELGYGLGFLFLFCMCFLASSLTAWMLSKEKKNNKNNTDKAE